jgi:hypothetical protein
MVRDARRAGALGLALLQLVAFAVLPTADALLDVEQVTMPLHVESDGSTQCAPPHDHLFCQAVRSLASATTTTVVAGAEAEAVSTFRLHPQSAGEVAAKRFLTRSVGSRAPPPA